MKTVLTQKNVVALATACAFVMLTACSSSPSPWTKKSSPWEQGGSSAEAPAADEYKEELAAVEAPAMEMEYQPEPMAEEVMVEVEPEPAMDAMPANDDIMSLPASYYTVQLMASVDLDRVYKFAENNQLSVRYVVPTNRDGITWHVLLLDVYPDYASARAGLAEVAGTLPTQPWIRKLGSVQNLMQ